MECSIILNSTGQHCGRDSELSNLAPDLNDAAVFNQEKQVIKFS